MLSLSERNGGVTTAGTGSQSHFPTGFVWGTATSAYQVEGNNRNADWWDFETLPGRIANGDRCGIACDHYHRYAEDFELLRAMNNNGHRLSIEWSRIQPAEGIFDAAEIEHYRRVLTCLRDLGMWTMVTLHHFTSPRWFARRGGWAMPGACPVFLAFVDRVVHELGELVDCWCTVNEPNLYAINGWLLGEFPPGKRGDWFGYYRALTNLRRAHEAAYELIKQRQPDHPVGLSHHRFVLTPATSRLGDVVAARIGRSVMDCWPDGRGRWAATMAARCDFVGISHYWGQLVALDLGRPRDLFSRRFDPPGLRRTDMGWAANPRWIRTVVEEARPLAKPVYVTENGLATTDDSWRQEYLRGVIGELSSCIQDGVAVRGYFHWTSMDNFEWARGYTQRFGLIAVDRASLERSVRPSGHLYSAIAAHNGLPGQERRS
jgi:beta-glucosidase